MVISGAKHFSEKTILPSETLKPIANLNTLENLFPRNTPMIFTTYNGHIEVYPKLWNLRLSAK